MSRHRNIRNLTEDDYDDYYDDDYYDDDDYYEEDEDDEAYYQRQQEQQRKEREERDRAAAAEQQRLQQKAATASKVGGGSSSSGGQQQQQQPSAAERLEKERIVEGMGFTSKQAKMALESSSYDVQQAIDRLLTGGTRMMSAPRPPAVAAPAAAATPSRDEERERMIAAFDTSRPAPPPSVGKGTATSSGSGTKKGNGKISPIPPSSATSMSVPSNNGPTTSANSGTTASAGGETPITITGPSTGKRAKISKDLMDRLKNQRSRLSMVVLGHVDAGKSTLMGQVLLLLGHVQKRTITKYEKQAAELGKASFALAWVMDTDDSERERGVTMDIGTKFAKTPTHDLTILDAPGHADFVPAMITGAASADVGLLVVAATSGEFEAGFDRGGQTREHIILSRGLGVSQLIVAVNKLDSTDWDEGRFEEIKARVMPFIQTNGFKPHRVRFVPVSGLTGVNVMDPPGNDAAAPLKAWYNGPTLLDAIDAFFPANRHIEKPMRIVISDLYAEGKGITAKGRCVQGICSVGDQVVVLPVGDVASITRIEHGKALSASNPYSYAKEEGISSSKDDAERAKVVLAGDSIDVCLSGIDIARIHPGNILSHVDQQLRPAVKRKFKASILVMDDISVPIIRGASVLFHMHSIDRPACVSKLVCTKNRDGTVKRQKPRVLAGGARATVEIIVEQKICIAKYADCRALGRFVLRRGGDTVAVGVVDEIIS